MIKMTVLYNYDKVVTKLSKVYGVSKQTVKDHFDDMNVEVFYQTRKAFGRDYLYWMIKQSDIEECRQWLNTHSKELAKDEAKRVRNSNGYVLDNHKDEPLHFNTQREIADFLGYKSVGFVIGEVYRGYELKSETTGEEVTTADENSDETTTETTSAENSSVPENNSIINTNTGKSVTNHTIVNDNTSIDIASLENQSLDTTVDNSDKSMYTQKSFEENINCNTEVESNETIVNDNTSTDIAKSEDENEPLDIASIPEHQPFVLGAGGVGDLDSKPTPKSDFESKIDAYFEKYYGGLE